MLEKKIDRAAHFLAQHRSVFRCPFCFSSFTSVKEHSMICEEGHRFDLSKKGTLYFLRKAVQTDYDEAMFSSRHQIITAGFYDVVLERLRDLCADVVGESGVLVDAGCGDGTFLDRLSELGLRGTKIGFDLSKDGILRASRFNGDAFWCVADMTNLPFADEQINLILNFLSPAHYGEFKRVLSENGQVVKVIPESGYLQELRSLLYQDHAEKQVYSNEKVYQKFKEEWQVVEDERVTYTLPVPTELQQDLLNMSPLQWGAEVPKDPETVCEKMTIDLRILVGERK